MGPETLVLVGTKSRIRDLVGPRLRKNVQLLSLPEPLQQQVYPLLTAEVLILDLGDHCHGRLGEEQEPEGKTNIKNRYKVLFIDTSLILKSEPRECGSQVSKGAGKLPRILPHLKIEKLTRVSITSKI